MPVTAKRSWGMAFAFILMAACALPAGAQAERPASVRVDTIIDHQLEILTYLSGSEPTPDERDRFIQSMSAKIRANPSYWAHFDATRLVPSLQILQGNSISAKGKTWVRWRRYYAFENIDGARVVAPHDRIVLLDKDHQILITETTLKIAGLAAYWKAQQTGQRLPDDRYIPILRNSIQQQSANWSTETLVQLTELPASFPAMVEGVQSMPEGQRRQFLAQLARSSGGSPQGAFSTGSAMSSDNGSPPQRYRQQQPQPSFQQRQAQASVDETQNFVFNQQLQRNFCSSLAFGSFTQGTGAFCRSVP